MGQSAVCGTIVWIGLRWDEFRSNGLRTSNSAIGCSCGAYVPAIRVSRYTNCCNGCSADHSVKYYIGRRHAWRPLPGSESTSRRAVRVGQGVGPVTRGNSWNDVKTRKIRPRRFCAPLTRSGYPKVRPGPIARTWRALRASYGPSSATPGQSRTELTTVPAPHTTICQPGVTNMQILQCLLAALTGWSRPRQSVSTHTKNQAHGPRWSRHRPRRINKYRRKRHRRGRRIPLNWSLLR